MVMKHLEGFEWWSGEQSLAFKLASALIACHDRKQSGSEGARRLFDAVNELFCWATPVSSEVQL